MSRRKQQNPKPLKYDEVSGLEIGNQQVTIDKGVSPSLSEHQPMTLAEHHENITEETISVKDEPRSPEPEQTVNPASPAECGDTFDSSLSSGETSLETLLGVPDDAPLKIQRCVNDGYKILSAKYITKGAGLDPLRAQKLDKAFKPEASGIADNPRMVSFHSSEGIIYFLLESSINCGWLKYLGIPSEERSANLRIYYVGGQLWVEVIKSLAEGEQLIAEFCEPSKRQYEAPPPVPSNIPTKEETDQIPVSTSSTPSPKLANPGEGPSVKPQFPCTLCGIPFRHSNTLAAHKQHYCSKLNQVSTSSNDAEVRSVSSNSSDEGKESISGADNLQQTAYMCLLCKYMSLTKAEMKTHVKEKHKQKAEHETSKSAGMAGIGRDKTYCEYCEIHFKKPESYQAHKQHYCKNRPSSSTTHSPRSDSGVTNAAAAASIVQSSQSASPISPAANSTKDIYKKVSVFDSQDLSTSLATQAAAAAMAAASLPFTLSSILNLPGMAALPMMSHLKMFQSPVLFAQAIESATKTAAATSAAASVSAATVPYPREETPLDLTVKQEIIMNAASATKRKSSGSTTVSPPAKLLRPSSTPASPATSNGMLPRLSNGHPKLQKTERPIYRCESCSIPFYKKDVYEAHRLHYCSRRVSSGSDREEEVTVPNQPEEKREPQPSPALPPADDRLVITYTCNKCSTSYRTIETFNAHQCAVPRASPPPPLLRCEECSYSTSSSRVLAEHMETHQKVNVFYKCKLCGYHGNTLRGMRQHGRQHMVKGEEFQDDDVEMMELPTPPQRLSLPVLAPPVAFHNDMEEELLRLKNEPYKKRRSRKHYQKSEYMGLSQVSPQRKENGLQRGESMSPRSTSTVSCASPLQISVMNVIQSEKSPVTSPTVSVAIKAEPSASPAAEPRVSSLVKQSPRRQTSSPAENAGVPAATKPHVCACNASFVSISTFEAHKKLYCSYHKSQRNNPPITVNH